MTSIQKTAIEALKGIASDWEPSTEANDTMESVKSESLALRLFMADMEDIRAGLPAFSLVALEDYSSRCNLHDSSSLPDIISGIRSELLSPESIAKRVQAAAFERGEPWSGFDSGRA